MLKYLRTPKNDPIRVQYSQIKNEIAVNKHLYPFNNGYGITKTLKTRIYSESKLSIFLNNNVVRPRWGRTKKTTHRF